MDVDAHRLELLRTFRNSPQDLDANRAGRIGPDQVRRLRRSATNSVLVMVGVVAVLAAIVALVAAHPISVARWVLIVVIGLAGVAVGVQRGSQLRRAVRDGTVVCLAGPVTTRMRGRAGWWLTVAGQSFHLPVRFWHIGPGMTYRVYVAPAAQLIVAMEPDVTSPPSIEDLIVTPITFTHTGDGERPYTATVHGVTVLIEVNDFPAEPLYSVLVGGQPLAHLEDWPPAWNRSPLPAELAALAVQTPRGAAVVAVTTPLNATSLRAWAQTLCTTAAPDTESVLRALHFDGALVNGIGYRRLAAPPAQTAHTDVTESGGELFTVRFAPGPVPVTRAELDAELGNGRELVRVHFDSAYTVAYPIMVSGAPFTCDMLASFRDQPAADAAASEITLRRQRAAR